MSTWWALSLWALVLAVAARSAHFEYKAWRWSRKLIRGERWTARDCQALQEGGCFLENRQSSWQSECPPPRRPEERWWRLRCTAPDAILIQIKG